MKKQRFNTIILLVCVVLISRGYVFAAEMTENIKKGILKMQMSRLDDARNYFEREKQSNPKNGLAYYYLGEVYYRQSEFSKALEQYQKAIEIEPNEAAYHLGAGIAYLALGQTDKATEEFQSILTAAPGTYEAKEAERQLARIKATSRNEDIIKKWQEAEKNKGIEIAVKKEEILQGPVQAVQTVSVESVVKDMRFGTETKRKEASKTLYGFSAIQLEPFLPVFIAQMDKEKNEDIRKNLLLVIGKTQTKEAVDYLFSVLEGQDYSFDTKMVALAGLSETLSPDAAERLKDILDTMVTRKQKMREDAKAKIQSIEQKMDDLEAQKLILTNDKTKLRTKLQEIYNKLNMQPAMPEGAQPPVPGAVPPGVAPAPAAGEQPVEMLTPEQIKQLRAELRKTENDITLKEKQVERLEKQIEKLKEEREKYQRVLVRKYSTGTVKVLGVTRAAPSQQTGQMPPQMPPTMAPGMPPEMPQMPLQPSTFQAGSEEEQEQSLALSIIKILGRIGKPAYLPVIEKAWDEYRADSFDLDYGLVRAQLGSYEYIEKLVARLQEDYPSSDMDEVYFRADIVKVLGNYLASHENQEYAELISYLAESDPNQVIKIAASQALSKIKSKEAEKTAKQT
ncbi:MAG: HEAT repeat domain-containing protein [Candidatus Ratteibacteria bacterium]